MNTFQTIIENAKKRKMQVYFNAISCPFADGLVGIENANNIVYWYEYTKEGEMLYRHAYNRNNGKTIKGFAMGYNFLLKLTHD